MVQTYKPKKTSRQAVDEESMQSAIQDVMQGVLSYRKAADKYNLKLSTLESRVKKYKNSNDAEGSSNRTFDSKYTTFQRLDPTDHVIVHLHPRFSPVGWNTIPRSRKGLWGNWVTIQMKKRKSSQHDEHCSQTVRGRVKAPSPLQRQGGLVRRICNQGGMCYSGVPLQGRWGRAMKMLDSMAGGK
ncbi:hypothetical protein JTB14_034887 [Gonioctena quinquepunctata]|nr:hypothetical protein JTB14_034887 [Gonioctena quinquepunctata]